MIALTLGVLAGCAGRPAGAQSAAASAAVRNVSPSPSDASDRRACAALYGLTTDQRSDPDRMMVVAAYGREATTIELRAAAEGLDLAARLAIAARGTDAEFARNLDLLSAEIRFDTVCIRGHYDD